MPTANEIPESRPEPDLVNVHAAPTKFEADLAGLINEHSEENGSNTPDWVLARYMRTCLDAFNVASRAREAWYGFEHKPGMAKPLHSKN